MEDSEERDAKRAQNLAIKQERELKKRSQPIQRKLPLPLKLNEFCKKPGTSKNDFSKVIFFKGLKKILNLHSLKHNFLIFFYEYKLFKFK